MTDLQTFLAQHGVNNLLHSADDGETHTGLCLVALPADTDMCRTVGAEEKHATLLFLGDNVSDDVTALIQSSLAEFMRISSWNAFNETVSGVNSLGPDGARVWMFDSTSGLRPIRERLLKQPAIRALFDSISQFPNYTPHMTIGYPAPGQSQLTDFEETRAQMVRNVTFDRIALWHGDDHSVIWRLPSLEDSYENAAAIHAEDMVHNFLAHHGIKGQKWGFRRQRGSDGTVEGGVKEHVSENAHNSADSAAGSHGHSADQERFLNQITKKPEQLSTADLKAVTSRAEALKKYNDLFGTNPHADLKTQLDHLKLQNDLATQRKIYSEHHPNTIKRLIGIAAHVAPGFARFKKLSQSDEGKRLTKFMVNEIRAAFKTSDSKEAPTATTSPGAPKQQPFSHFKKNSKSSDFVYNVTTVGQHQTSYPNPHIPRLP